MRDEKQPDGTWATTPIYAGGGSPPPACADHDWHDMPIPPGGPPGGQVQMQTCPRCGYARARYLFDPHPEA